MQLDTGKTINGKAGTNSAITYTITGDLKTSGVDSYQVAVQGQLSTSASTPLYTVPASAQLLISVIKLSNTTASPVTGVTFYIAGSAAGNQTDSITIPANGNATSKAGAAFVVSDANGGVVPTTLTLTGDVTGSGTTSITTTLATGNAGNLNSGTLLAARMPALTGDTTSSAGSTATTNVKIQGVAVSASAPTNGQVLQLVAGSPNTWTPESYGGDVSGGPSASVVQAIQTETVNPVEPIIGQVMAATAGTYDWGPTTNVWNVAAFGADGTGNGDVTLAFYNAIISTALVQTDAARATTSVQVTCTGTFSISVGANTLASGTNTIIAQTTTGAIKIQYTGGGGTGTLTGCTVTLGTSGGILLSGSIIGTQTTTYPTGGEVYVPSGAYLISQPIVVTLQGVHIRGAAATMDSDSGSIVGAGGSIIYWSGGAVGATMMSFIPTWSGGQTLIGAYAENIYLNCASVAGIGLQYISCHQWEQRHVVVVDPIYIAFDYGVVVNGFLGEPCDCTRGVAYMTEARCLEGSAGTNTLTTTSTAVLNTFTGAATLALSGTPSGWPTTNGVIQVQAINQVSGAVMYYIMTYTGGGNTSTLTGVQCIAKYANSPEETSSSNFLPTAKLFSGAAVRQAVPINAVTYNMDGSQTANTSVNTFIMCTSKYGNKGAWIGNSDSNVFLNCVHNQSGGGNGIGYDVQGSTLSGASGSAGSSRNNQWISGSAGLGGITLRGTDSFSYLQPASANRWDAMEVANGEPLPVIGTGAGFQYTCNGLLAPGVVSNVSIASATGAASATGLIVGTNFTVPPQGTQAGATFRWTIPMSKTATGTALTIAVKYGTTNTSADGSVATMTLTSTAAIDSGILNINLVVISTTAALATSWMTDRLLVTTGFSTTAAPLQLVQMAMTPFTAGLPNPGPAYWGVYVTVNTGGVLTFLAPVTTEVLRASNP